MTKRAGWVSVLTRQEPELWEPQILEELDKSFQRASFPNLSTDEHGAYARSRLTAFRSGEEWLIIFEILAYVDEAGMFMDQGYAYGNKVKHPGLQIEPRPSHDWLLKRRVNQSRILLPVEIFTPAPGQPSIDEEGWLPSPFDFAITLHGKVRHFTPARDVYRQVGIDLDQPLSRNVVLDRYIQILRLLSYLIPEDLFLSEGQLLESVRRPTVLSRFLQTYDWHCPDPTKQEKPSDSPCLRSLAHALAYNQSDIYECSSDLVNTHWSQWPNYFLK